MSYGYAGRQQKAVLRGIMATQILMQLLTQTQWGELDYLIFDTPPGTGDIAISLGQEIKYAAAVIVTTPQRLSYIDVIKGIEMWDDLKVPTVSVVENMVVTCSDFQAYMQEKDDDKPVHVFGKGNIPMLKGLFGIKNSFEIPLRSHIAKYSDAGAPVVLSLPKSERIPQIFSEIAANLDKECDRLEQEGSQIPNVRYETGKSLVIVREYEYALLQSQWKGKEDRCQDFKVEMQMCSLHR